MKPYDSDEARKILQGTLEERIINYAEIKYDKGEEVKEKLYKGGYRNEATDPLEVLEQVCGGKEIVEPEVVDSIDDVVGYKKPSMVKVAVKGTWNLARKIHLHQWYYPLVGMLPAKYQGKIAEKLGDNDFHYTTTNVIVEGVAAGGVLGYFFYQRDPGIALLVVVAGMLAGVINGLVRSVISKINGVNAAGSVVFIPYFAVKVLVDSFSSAKKELEQEQQKLLEKKPRRALINQSQARVEQLNSARIEQPKPEMVENEFDEELADFDQRLEESKRSKE